MVDLQAHRYELYWLNLWRNVNPAQPILNDHLAILDRSSLSRDDVETHKLDFDGYQIEQLLLKSHMPHHRWTYFSEMAADEVLVFPQGKGVAERDGPGEEWRFEMPDSPHPESIMHMGVHDPRHPEAGRHSQENRFCAIVRADAPAAAKLPSGPRTGPGTTPATPAKL